MTDALGMTVALRIIVFVASGATMAGLSFVALGRPRRLMRGNYRGRYLPVTLGLAAGIALVAAGTGIVLYQLKEVSWVDSRAPELLAAVIVLLAGLVDDLVPGRARGLRGHLRELARGRVSTGVIKAMAAFLAAVVVVATQPGGDALTRTAAVVLIASSANLWNLLDVAPGRAAKGFLICALALLLPWVGALLLCAVGAMVVLGWVDLRERGMLGDAGANLLGFLIGAEAYARLPEWGIIVAAISAVSLNLLGETVTLSRLIDAVPPVRWLDRVGRLSAWEQWRGRGDHGPERREDSTG